MIAYRYFSNSTFSADAFHRADETLIFEVCRNDAEDFEHGKTWGAIALKRTLLQMRKELLCGWPYIKELPTEEGLNHLTKDRKRLLAAIGSTTGGCHPPKTEVSLLQHGECKCTQRTLLIPPRENYKIVNVRFFLNAGRYIGEAVNGSQELGRFPVKDAIETIYNALNAERFTSEIVKALLEKADVETDWLEYKASLSESAPHASKLEPGTFEWEKFAKPILCLANTHGGILLIGVEDRTRKIAGWKDQDTIPRLQTKQNYTVVKNNKTKRYSLPEFPSIKFCDLMVDGLTIKAVYARKSADGLICQSGGKFFAPFRRPDRSGVNDYGEGFDSKTSALAALQDKRRKWESPRYLGNYLPIEFGVNHYKDRLKKDALYPESETFVELRCELPELSESEALSRADSTRIKIFSEALKEAISGDKTCILLRGSASSGKTAHLKYWMRKWLSRVENGDVLIHVNLKHFKSDNIWEFLRDHKSVGDNLVASELTSLARSGRLLVLLDGLDDYSGGGVHNEGPSKVTTWINDLHKRFPKLRVVATSRTNSEDESVQDHLEKLRLDDDHTVALRLLPMNTDEKIELVERHKVNNAESEILDKLPPILGRLSERPYFLSGLVLLYQRSKDLSIFSALDVLDDISKRPLGAESDMPVSPNELDCATLHLEQLAFECTVGGLDKLDATEIVLGRGEALASRFLDWVIKAGVVFNDAASGRVSFSEQVVGDFLAGRFLSKTPSRWKDITSEHRTVAAMAMAHAPVLGMASLRRVKEIDPWLAAVVPEGFNQTNLDRWPPAYGDFDLLSYQNALRNDRKNQHWSNRLKQALIGRAIESSPPALLAFVKSGLCTVEDVRTHPSFWKNRKKLAKPSRVSVKLLEVQIILEDEFDPSDFQSLPVKTAVGLLGAGMPKSLFNCCREKWQEKIDKHNEQGTYVEALYLLGDYPPSPVMRNFMPHEAQVLIAKDLPWPNKDEWLNEWYGPVHANSNRYRHPLPPHQAAILIEMTKNTLKEVTWADFKGRLDADWLSPLVIEGDVLNSLKPSDAQTLVFYGVTTVEVVLEKWGSYWKTHLTDAREVSLLVDWLQRSEFSWDEPYNADYWLAAVDRANSDRASGKIKDSRNQFRVLIVENIAEGLLPKNLFAGCGEKLLGPNASPADAVKLNNAGLLAEELLMRAKSGWVNKLNRSKKLTPDMMQWLTLKLEPSGETLFQKEDFCEAVDKWLSSGVSSYNLKGLKWLKAEQLVSEAEFERCNNLLG